ncbi:MAG: UTP--glucose-1-phosphate uridylyltransferase [Planctomycetes bacterium]|nr:UTP--glucose-1-phosphate uridylyltransferase [Planctomycetota bacterium]
MTAPTEPQLAFLQQFGYDADLQRRWQQDLAAGRLSLATNAVTGDLLAPPPGTVQKLPGSGTKAWRELERLGRDAIGRGEVGVVVLNGGMATRFGGVVKGVVPVLGASRSFLGLCVEDVQAAAREAQGRIPLFLMNSFATLAATEQHFAQHEWFGKDPAEIVHFTQFVALRMDKKGELFRLDNGELSPYGPGHGDFPAAFRRCGALQRFLDGGGRWLLVRNVDNLGARVDPVLLGHHIQRRCEATVELAPKWPEDVGGSPFQYLGRTQLIEQVRFRPGFDPNIVDVFNTNTFWFSAQALDRDFDLGWYYVEKTVEGRKAVQVEHLVGELTAFLSTNFLQIRRSGKHTRFLPVKTPEDLAAAREEIAEMYDDGGDADA